MGVGGGGEGRGREELPTVCAECDAASKNSVLGTLKTNTVGSCPEDTVIFISLYQL